MSSDAIKIAIQSVFDAKGIAGATKAIQQLQAAVTKMSAPAGGGPAVAFDKSAAAAQKAAIASQKLATETQKTAAANNQAATAAQRLATEEQRTATAASNAAAAQTRAEKAALQLAQAQRHVNSAAGEGSGYFQQFGSAAVGSLTSVIAPVAAVSAAFGVAREVVQSFGEAITFKAELDASRGAIDAQLRSVRDSGQVWNEAAAFADKYKITQADMTATIQASVGVMRASNATTTDLLTTLSRLQVLAPEKPISEAARALRELQSGDTTSIKELFNIAAKDANRMKAEIQGGADAVAVVARYLDQAGVGMDALAAKTTGAAGAARDLAKAQEDLKLAQAEFAQGPGLALLQGQIDVTRGATRLLSGDFETAGASASQFFSQVGADASANFGQFVQGTIDAATGQAALNAQWSAGGGPLSTLMAGTAAAAGAITYQSQAMVVAGQAASQLITQEAQLAAEAQASAQASMTDAANKQALTAQTQLLTAQTQAAVNEFLALNPGITTSGIAAAVAAGKIPPLIGQLAAAAVAARNAAAALAQFNAMQGLKAPAVGDRRNSEANDLRAQQRAEAGRRAADVRQAGAAQAAAERDRTLAIGTAQQKIALYDKEYQAAVKMYGAESVQAYQAQTKVLDAQQAAQSKRAGSHAGGLSKIEAAEQKTGDKLLSIDSQTQQKLIDLDRKAAEERARAQQELANQIATSSADLIAQQEANDLELVGASDQQRAALIAREQAEAKARISNEQAVAEARQTAADGDAKTAQDVLAVRQDAIQKQQSLDEDYAKKQAELAGNPELLAQLQQQYEQATQAAADAEQLRVDLATQAGQQRMDAAAAERDAVIGASEDQKVGVLSSFGAQASGASSWASAMEGASSRVVSAAHAATAAIRSIPSPSGGGGSAGGGGGGSGGTRAAGGLTGITRGPTTLTVGDNPGGAELVSVTPLSGRGTSSIGAGWAKMPGGGVIASVPGLPDPSQVPVLVETGAAGAGRAAERAARGASQVAASLKAELEAAKQALELIKTMAELRDLAQRPNYPISEEWIWGLAQEARNVLDITQRVALPMTKQSTEAMKFYTDAAKEAIGVVKDIADLRKQAIEPNSPISTDWIWGLAQEASAVSIIVTATLVPTTEAMADGMSSYTSSVSDAVGVIKDIADLRHESMEPNSPISRDWVWGLAQEAQQVTQIVAGALVPTTEAQADAFSNYGSAAGDAIGVIKDTIDLRSQLADAKGGPIDVRAIERIAGEAQRITRIVEGQLLPTTEDQADALQTYADTVGSSVSAVKSVLDLSGDMFAGYHSPSDAQIRMVATDALRIARTFFQAASTLNTDGVKAGQAYAEAVGATFAAAKDGLIVIQAINSGTDFQLSGRALGQFEQGGQQIIDAAGRLGERAAAIPAGDLTALQNVSGALSSWAEAQIRMAAVPFGNLSSLAGAMGGGGRPEGGGNTIYMSNTFTLPAGTTQQQAREIAGYLNQQIRGYR